MSVSKVCSSVCATCVFFFKQKTAYEMRISYWSSDVCSSDLSDLWQPGREDRSLGLDHLRLQPRSLRERLHHHRPFRPDQCDDVRPHRRPDRKSVVEGKSV